MVKPLTFKGEKKHKKRKHHEVASTTTDGNASSSMDPSQDESWTMPEFAGELTGPTLIVLPTVPPTCLASDPNGNVFASPLENMIEGDPKTAEPHSVQQVWIASRVAGMASNEVNFKGSHGGYLSCDQYGILGARREARGREETFVLDMVSDESGRTWYQLRTAATSNTVKSEEYKYIGAILDSGAAKKEADDGRSTKKVSLALRGDVESSSEDTRVLLRMQVRFKPQTQAAKEAARVKEKISRQELESAAGRTLTDEEARRLKRAKRDGSYHEAILDVRAKGKHDKYA
ncbi:hypothetical protein H2198_010063 [Neophaeococcomyces mojaviensis]|uniref:Uncharacterized protein n=1 Tax=Neophaeococcomyces mojaviensis TaxID=3383035 RepID=A0ACC2ZSU7_9EURO|nr:hypothetical protein H2198_010063 [Knufia sp. JES_112]